MSPQQDDLTPDDAAADMGTSPRLREAQNMLAALGFAISDHHDSAGAIDGIWGRQTRRAVEQFQADQDLEVSGQLDEETFTLLADTFALARQTESSALTEDAPPSSSGDAAAQAEAVLSGAAPGSDALAGLAGEGGGPEDVVDVVDAMDAAGQPLKPEGEAAGDPQAAPAQPST